MTEQGRGPTVGLVHGFTQTGRSWGRIAALLAAGRRVVSVDAPGHGRSGAVVLDLYGAGAAVAEACGTADLVGYSMGGRICLHAALVAPAAVRSLVLVGATAGIPDPVARAERRRADEALADRLLAAGDEGLGSFLEDWLASPLFATLGAEAADLPSRLLNTAAGLASSLRACGTGVQDPLDVELRRIASPVLLVVGERDTKFRGEAERLAAALGDARIAVVRGAGHACHLEQPDLFVELVRGWLDQS